MKRKKPKPSWAGVWQWYDERGQIRLVHVCDVGFGVPYLRVYFWGGYYDVHDGGGTPAEWPDSWGDYVGPIESFGNEELYQMPDGLTI